MLPNIDKSSASAAIASMIISLAKTLNMQVLAEGVETQAELHCLKTLGCYNYQGFYFSKPMLFDDFVALLTPLQVLDKNTNKDNQADPVIM